MQCRIQTTLTDMISHLCVFYVDGDIINAWLSRVSLIRAGLKKYIYLYIKQLPKKEIKKNVFLLSKLNKSLIFYLFGCFSLTRMSLKIYCRKIIIYILYTTFFRHKKYFFDLFLIIIKKKKLISVMLMILIFF